jgi:hypothetical protein
MRATLANGLGIAGFVVGIAVVPGIIGLGLVGRWLAFGVAMAVLLFEGWPPKPRMLRPHPVHLFLLLTLAWAAISISWEPVWTEGVNGLIQLSFILAAIAIGLEVTDARPLMIGLGLAVTVSLTFAIAQVAGHHPVPALNVPAGLFVNRIMFGEAAGIAFVGAVAYRLWFLALPTFASVILSQCRGAWLACIVCAALWLWHRSRIGAIVMLFTVCLLVWFVLPYLMLSNYDFYIRGSTALERYFLWRNAIEGLNFLGNGIGSFYTMSPHYDSTPFAFREAHAHNDIIELVFELGAGAIFLITVFMVALSSNKPARWPFIAFLSEGLVGFPLHSPTTSMVGAVLAGVLCVDRSRIWEPVAIRRMADEHGSYAAATLSGQLFDHTSGIQSFPTGLRPTFAGSQFSNRPAWTSATRNDPQGSG